MSHAHNAILAFLRENVGEYYSAYLVAKHAGQPVNTTRQALLDLVDRQVIRRAGKRSATTYYVPSAAQLAAEQRNAPVVVKVLAPRPLHAARIVEIRAARAAFPSLYAMKGGAA